ncbi:MAG TPA: ClpXP protease specificity-enhancing factor [Rhodanobacteraceae bacterium]|nr:ClpXP protease specificity-enhancing factor [Rhodanobacteraceae bacterium]
MTEQSPAMTSNRPYLLRAVHEWICDNGLTPHIVVDAGKPGVQVPPQAISDGRVVLNLAPRAVTRLEIGNDAITFMARFGGVSQPVNVPVAAVQAIYARENGQGMLLAEDPSGTAPPIEPLGDAGKPSAKASGPSLQAVPASIQESPAADDAGESPPPSSGDGPDKPRPKGKPTLHVVK